MATKSPGIYYTEKDNTYYSNPKSAIGTTLAVVGFAKKGPTDKPVEINSWKSFVDTFGDAIDGKYTGLAIKNYLAAGGTVMFKRIADNELSKPSSYIIKNGKPAKAAYAYFKKKGDILAGDANYIGASLYGFKVNYGSEKPAEFTIRAPKKGARFTQQAIVKQIDDQLKGVKASYEGLLGNIINDNLFSFKLTSTELPDSDNVFYIKSGTYDSSKKAFVEKLERRLKRTNAIAELTVCSNGASEGSGGSEGFTIANAKSFKFIRDGKEQTITVPFEEQTYSLEQIAEKINKALAGTDVYAISSNNKLYFIDMLYTTSTLEINSKMPESLFTLVETPPEDPSGKLTSNFPAYESARQGSVYVQAYDETDAKAIDSDIVESVIYDDITESVIITSKKNDIKLENEITKGPDKNFIGDGGLIIKSHEIKKQAGISKVRTYIDSNKQIRIEFTDVNEKSIKIETLSVISQSGKIDILDFTKTMGDAENKNNEPLIDDKSKDLIIIKSKEVGSGTSDIAVETSTIINPLNEKDVKTNITVYINGILKETFKGKEDVEFTYNSEKRFDKIINKDPEDGGSNYINIDIVRNNKESPNIDLPQNGYWKLGQKNKEDDVMFDGVDDDYYSYNYIVGNDGIPEDGGDYLFLEELDPINSDLANKELYDYHIIQTPDNNSSVVQDARIKLCETRGDVFTIIDPPAGLTKKEVIDWHNGIGRDAPIDSNYAAVYWPWCKVFDTTSGKGKYAWVMPSLIMAPQYARVDRTVGSQAAPAGENNGVLPVIDIERYPNTNDRDELYVNYNRINPLVKFKDGTILAYGEKTTQRRETTLTKIHTRRMLIQIKKQCRTALRGYLFEPNTADYLGKISSNVTAILEGYKANGGLSFYKVICDETNNPVEIRQRDIINVDVALVPQGTIEQININLTLNKSEETIAD